MTALLQHADLQKVCEGNNIMGDLCIYEKLYNSRLFYPIVRDSKLFLEKKSKLYFLLMKMKDYENKLHNHPSKNFINFRNEKKWRRFRKKYNKIEIYGIRFESIGETIPRLFMFLSDSSENNTYRLVLPTFFPGYYIGGIVNKSIFNIFGRYIHFVTNKNLDFWKYVMFFHSKALDISHFDEYRLRDVAKEFNVKLGEPLIPFTNKQSFYGEEKLRKMGVRGKYICLHAREVATKKQNFVSTYDDTSVVDNDINSYGQACNYMQQLGYQAVRLGKDESVKCIIPDVIDYANLFYDDFMDFYLIANCKFLIGCSSGITAIAAFWGRPILHTNALSFCYGQESLPRTEYDIYIPKKFYSEREKRFLNMYEMWDISYKCDRFNKRFQDERITVIDNTEQEILEATIEMNKKIDHTWMYTKEENDMMQKYWDITNLWKSQHEITYISRKKGGLGRDAFPRPICYSYLKNNLYLLDVKEPL